MNPYKFLDKTIKKWKMYFGITNPVFWTTNFKIWKQLGCTKVGFTGESVFGSIHTPQNIIFVSLKKNDTKEEMETTIVHELLHTKFPRLRIENLR